MFEMEVQTTTIIKSIGSNVTLQEIIDYLLSQKELTNKVIINMNYDNKSIDFYSNLSQKFQLEKEKIIGLKLEDRDTLFIDSLKTNQQLLAKILEEITLYVDSISENKVTFANSIFVKIIDYLQIFIEYLSFLNGEELEIWSNAQKLKYYEDKKEHMLEICKNLLVSQKNKDFTHISDLLSYELKKEIVTWKSDLKKVLISKES